MLSQTVPPPLNSPEQSVKPFFSRHETFHPRYGWLKKAVDQIAENPTLFTQEDAPVVLGVGKNMVTAIRYWSQAFKLIEEYPEDQSQSGYKVTGLGEKIIRDGGFDPFIEDTATLWLLHWHLLKPSCQAATWYYLFNRFSPPVFSVDEAMNGLQTFKDEEFPTAKAVPASLRKDLMCLMRMYASASTEGKQVKEESIDSPFRDLALIQHVRSTYYQFNIGSKSNLPAAIVGYACLDFALSRQQNHMININTLLYETGSPGMVFKLSEPALYAALETLGRLEPRIKVSESAGLVQLVFETDAQELQDALLQKYYSRG